jgi:hypothetical protein
VSRRPAPAGGEGRSDRLETSGHHQAAQAGYPGDSDGEASESPGGVRVTGWRPSHRVAFESPGGVRVTGWCPDPRGGPCVLMLESSALSGHPRPSASFRLSASVRPPPSLRPSLRPARPPALRLCLRPCPHQHRRLGRQGLRRQGRPSPPLQHLRRPECGTGPAPSAGVSGGVALVLVEQLVRPACWGREGCPPAGARSPPTCGLLRTRVRPILRSNQQHALHGAGRLDSISILPAAWVVEPVGTRYGPDGLQVRSGSMERAGLEELPSLSRS